MMLTEEPSNSGRDFIVHSHHVAPPVVHKEGLIAEEAK